MTRIPFFKPFPVRWARILGAYLLLLVSAQIVIYLTIKDDPGRDYVPFNDPRWALHVVEALTFHGPQYRYLTWFSVVCVGIIAALNLIRPCNSWIRLYIVVEAVFILPNALLTV